VKGIAGFAALALTGQLPAAHAQQVPEVEVNAVSHSAIDLPRPIVTRHRGTFNGRSVDYEARVEPYEIVGLDGAPAARLVSISYIVQGPESADRPVLFVFNGGPIVPSSVLHMGALGPKRTAVPEDVRAPASEYRVVDNPHTLLDVADIVFFDPAGTGFSRMLEGVSLESQFSIAADANQLARLVIAWSETHGRANAPKYLVGQSYGTLRAPEAAAQLQQAGVPVAGVVLLGQALNIVEYAQRPANIISYVVSLPTLAAIAWEHGKADRRGRSFETLVRDAQDFANGEYLSVLFLGRDAAPHRRLAAAERLEEFTGVGADIWAERELRISKVDYQRLLIPGMILDTNDARYAAPAAGGGPAGFGLVREAWRTDFLDHLRDHLRADHIGDYVPMVTVGGFNGWDWGPNRSPFGDWPYAQTMTRLFESNPEFRALIGNGYFDTQTTIGAMDYLLAQADWPTDRIRRAYYRGGHMPYTVEESLRAFTADLRALVTRQW
jgi:hypothetical protein